jgi:outer membrane autotransporter protein
MWEGLANRMTIAALQYLSLWRNSFAETGAGAADLSVAGSRADSFRSYLGGRVVCPLKLCGWTMQPEAHAFWLREYASDTRTISNTFAGGGLAFPIWGQNLGRDWGLLGAGLIGELSERLRVGLHYDGYFTRSATAHGGRADVELRW